MIADFSPETMETQISRTTFFKCEKNYQPRILYPVKISFRNAYEIKTFLYERKLIELAASRTALSIKEVLQTQGK